jgi:hypothetical protein
MKLNPPLKKIRNILTNFSRLKNITNLKNDSIGIAFPIKNRIIKFSMKLKMNCTGVKI